MTPCTRIVRFVYPLGCHLRASVLLALGLLSLWRESKPLLLLLLEPRSRNGLYRRSSSGSALASQTMEMC